METQQPKWKCVGRLGDVDPVAYGGGFVFEDETGVYAPEIELIEPASDEDHDRLGEDKAKVTVSRFIIERKPESEWWFDKLTEVANSYDYTTDDFKSELEGTVMMQARVYQALVGYFGAFEFDQYPLQMTETEAYARYRAEMEALKR